MAQSVDTKKVKVALGDARRLRPWWPTANKSSEEDSSSDSKSPRRPSSVFSTATTCEDTKSPRRVSLVEYSSGTGSTTSLLEDQDFESTSEANSGTATPAIVPVAKDPVDYRLLGRIKNAVSSLHNFLKLRHSDDGQDGVDEGLDANLVEEPAFPPTDETRIPGPGKAAWRAKAPAWCADPAKAQSNGNEKLTMPKASEKSWASRQQARRGLQSSTSHKVPTDAEICRKMTSILNKLTIEKFDKLSRELVSCGIQTSSHLEILIDEIFEKATTQHHFINMYAVLCEFLCVHFAENPITDDPQTNFKKILLTSCQNRFEKHRTPPAYLNTLEGEELAEAEQLYKTRMLGNLRFIGALLVRKMLASKVMFAILEEFLAASTAEALESLATLLTVVGPVFDAPEFPGRVMLMMIFDKVQELCKRREISARVRCLLQDVLDLRSASWTDKKPKKLEGPSTLEQVAQKFRAEAPGFAGPVKRSPTHEKSQGGSQGAPARWADINAGGNVTPSQSSTHEKRQNSVAGAERVPQEKAADAQRSRDRWREERKKVRLSRAVVSGDPIKNELVDKLKTLQSSCQEFKKTWGTFCLSQEGNNRDPMRHSVEVLQQFLQDHCPSDPISPRVTPSEISRLVSDMDATAQPTCSSPPRRQEIEPSAQQVHDNPAGPKLSKTEFRQRKVRKELEGTLAELRLSHDVQEAVERVACLNVPGPLQTQELCELIVSVAEESSEAARKAGFDFIANLFDKGHWKPTALCDGVQNFIDVLCVDLKMDVPALPKILCEELCPVLQPFCKRGWLTANHLKALAEI